MERSDVKVLFVGADEDDYVIIRAHLRDIAGTRYAFEQALDPRVALDRLLGGHVDVCLVDQGLPERAGIKLIDEATTRGCPTPFILLSSLETSARRAVVPSAAVEFIHKENLTSTLLAQTIRHATERARMVQVLLDRERRLAAQQRALLSLATLPALRTGDMDEAMIEITRVAADTLEAARVGVWIFDDGREVMRRAHLHVRAKNPTVNLPALRVDAFPEFFRALESERIIVADDPAAQIATHRLFIRYLGGRGVTSALFAPLRRGDELFGMLGCEHAGGPRTWALEEQNFLSSVSDLLALVFEAHERNKAETALKETEARYALAAVGARDGLWDWVVDRAEAYLSPRFKEMLGFEADELPDLIESWFKRIHPDDRKAFKTSLDNHLADRAAALEHEHRLAHRDGSYRWVLCRGVATRNEEGEATRIAGSVTDVTERRTTEDQLVHEIFHDSLTGLPNRTALIKQLARTIKSHKSNGGDYFGLLVIGVEEFDEVRQSMGTRYANQLAFGVSQRLEALLRPGDSVARVGPDRFGILLHGMKAVTDAARVGERINAAFADPFVMGAKSRSVRPHIGVALSASGYQRPEDYLKEANLAMERARANADKTQVSIEIGLGPEIHALMDLEADLARAIEVDAFVALYQPVISLHSRRITAFEALARWSHPEQGLIQPADFLPVAEETGLVEEMDRLILRRACQEYARWGHPSRTPPLLYVNVANRTFLSPGYARVVRDALADAQLSGHLLRLEIKQSVLIDEPDAARAVMRDLSALGVQINIDAFGRHFSSITTLRRLPVDALKIDPQFIAHINDESEDREAVETILSLARRLGRRVVGCGIERRAQYETLRALTCDYGQGHFFAKPQDAQRAAQLLKPRRKKKRAVQ